MGIKQLVRVVFYLGANGFTDLFARPATNYTTKIAFRIRSLIGMDLSDGAGPEAALKRIYGSFTINLTKLLLPGIMETPNL